MEVSAREEPTTEDIESAEYELRMELTSSGGFLTSGRASRLVENFREEVRLAERRAATEKALREAAVTVRALAPKYLASEVDLAIFHALDMAAGEIDPGKK